MKVSRFCVGSPWPTRIILEMAFRMCRSPAVGVAGLRGDGPYSRVAFLCCTLWSQSSSPCFVWHSSVSDLNCPSLQRARHWGAGSGPTWSLASVISGASTSLAACLGIGRVDRMSPMASVLCPHLTAGIAALKNLLGAGLKRDGKSDRTPRWPRWSLVTPPPPPSALTFW